MPKKPKVTNADSVRLVKRLREAHEQLRAHSTRAARAADTLAKVLRQVEAEVGSDDGTATRRATTHRQRPTTSQGPISS